VTLSYPLPPSNQPHCHYQARNHCQTASTATATATAPHEPLVVPEGRRVKVGAQPNALRRKGEGGKAVFMANSVIFMVNSDIFIVNSNGFMVNWGVFKVNWGVFKVNWGIFMVNSVILMKFHGKFGDFHGKLAEFGGKSWILIVLVFHEICDYHCHCHLFRAIYIQSPTCHHSK
jgi:hypothetical protein